MENVIYILERVRSVLSSGAILLPNTRSNMDNMLGCVQLLDCAIDELKKLIQDAKEGESNGEQN